MTATRSAQHARLESLWLLLLGCLLASCLALCGRSPAARAQSSPAAPAASAELGDAGVLTSEAVVSAGGGPDPGRVTHGLSATADGAAAAERDRPPGASPNDNGPSPAIFPNQELTIRFNHQRHVKDLKLTCTTCHDRAKTSRSSADSLLPKGTRCDACHGSDHRNPLQVRAAPTDATDSAGSTNSTSSTKSTSAMGQCAYCHLGYSRSAGNRVAPLSVPKPNLRFDHALHASRNIGCAQCHGAVENLELATRDQLPRMRGCLNCHQAPGPAAGRARSECRTCHLTDPSGLIQADFASGPLLPPSWLHDAGHGPDWLERHKAVAGNDTRFCANCHSERYCADCHDGRVRPRRVHPNDWLSMHSVPARTNQQKCASCHRDQSFCLTCHQRLGIAMSGPFANMAERGRFHPPKSEWTDGPRTARHHAWEAERNISACVSCHVERDCAICHATAAMGGRGSGFPAGQGQGTNPHPIGFRSRCASALRQNARPCLVCHTPDDPNLLDCR
ncbi:MAG TPA: cytochrome c3 family protein [Polyangiaceae bacterium]|nr:cytochrome c3 family protein [Polyangiaceae bacterium]